MTIFNSRLYTSNYILNELSVRIIRLVYVSKLHTVVFKFKSVFNWLSIILSLVKPYIETPMSCRTFNWISLCKSNRMAMCLSVYIEGSCIPLAQYGSPRKKLSHSLLKIKLKGKWVDFSTSSVTRGFQGRSRYSQFICVCLSVSKIIAYCWTDMVLLYSEASH